MSMADTRAKTAETYDEREETRRGWTYYMCRGIEALGVWSALFVRPRWNNIVESGRGVGLVRNNFKRAPHQHKISNNATNKKARSANASSNRGKENVLR
jgi:hypothetical protein